MRILALLLSGFVMVTTLLVAGAGNAAAQGAAAAQRELGMAYYAGRGVKQDANKAVEHLARAVEVGDAESAIRLGKMYEYGMGVTNAPQHVKASAESAEAKLTPAEISRGRELAKQWRERRTPSPARTAW